MPSAQLPDRQTSPIQKAVSIFILVCLALLALLCVVNSFVSHMTPDISVYLLHTRTFVQDFDRFTLSHDSKGIMLTFILALPVLIFGPTMAAAAFIQFIAHAAAFTAGYFILRRYSGTIPAAIISVMGFCAIHSYRIWGGNARPEDFALAFIFVALWAGLQGERKHLALAGAMATCCFFLKISLLVTPAAVIICAILYNAFSRGDESPGNKLSAAMKSFIRDSAWTLIGLTAVAVITLVWILLFDDIHGWYEQTIAWPLKYRSYSIPFMDKAKATYDLIQNNKLAPLLLAGCVGLLLGWTRGFRRESILLAVAILAELYRINTEIARWHYLLAILVALLLIATAFLACTGNRKTSSVFVWVIPLIFLLPYGSDLPRLEWRAFHLKFIKKCPSPSQFFVDEFRSVYTEGDTIFIASNDIQLFLLLDAPRPTPVLPIHYRVVSTEKQQATRLYYQQFPPDWIIKRSSPSDRPLPNISGGGNYAFHVQCPADTLPEVDFPDIREQSGSSLSLMLPETSRYRIEVETGYFQAWRLMESTPPGTE